MTSTLIYHPRTSFRKLALYDPEQLILLLDFLARMNYHSKKAGRLHKMSTKTKCSDLQTF